MNFKNLMLSLAGAAIALASLSANATTAGCYSGGGSATNYTYVGGCDGKSYFSFDKVDTNSTAADVGANLSLRIGATTYSGKSYVLFRFDNYVPTSYKSSIVNVYFDDVDGAALLNSVPLYNHSSEVSFSLANAATNDLPDYNGDFDADYSLRANTTWFTSERKNGVSAGEYVTFWGLLNNGKSVQNVLDAISDGTFKVGINLSTLVTNYNYWGHATQTEIKTSYLNDNCLTPVPLPAAAWLFGSALIGFVTVSNRRKV